MLEYRFLKWGDETECAKANGREIPEDTRLIATLSSINGRKIASEFLVTIELRNDNDMLENAIMSLAYDGAMAFYEQEENDRESNNH